MRVAIPIVAYLAGITAITVGLFLVAVPVGLIGGGALSAVSAFVWPYIEVGGPAQANVDPFEGYRAAS